MTDAAWATLAIGCLVAGAGLGWLILWYRIRDRLRSLEAEARTDPLTELWNLRAIREQLQIHVAIACRYKAPLCVILVDIDHFKVVNDRLGHAAGDQVLSSLSRLLTTCCRDADIVGRRGGDEFVFILPQTDRAGGRVLAERIRERASQQVGINNLQIRVSLGVAQLREQEGPAEVLARADQALYRAKQSGRDRTCLDDES